MLRKLFIGHTAQNNKWNNLCCFTYYFDKKEINNYIGETKMHLGRPEKSIGLSISLLRT